MSTSIPKELFDKASSAVFTKTALSLEHCDEIVRIVLEAVDLEASAKIISLEAELAKLRELEAENREQYQIALRAKDERDEELETILKSLAAERGRWGVSEYKEILGRDGNPLTGVRYTEERLAQCFEPSEDGFAVLHALAHQAITKYGAAKLIQKVLRGHRASVPFVDTTKALKPYLDDLHKSEAVKDDASDASELE